MSEPGSAAVTGAAQRRLHALAQVFEGLRGTMRYVDHKQAERDCERLAGEALEVFSRDDLRTFSFVAIPRGGLVVLGMLAYALDLRPEQLLPDLSSDRPLFIVDDCALTGARFGALLRRSLSRHIVFAHLYSHPDLRRAILEREPHVKQCLAAHDLVNRGVGLHADRGEYEAWRRRWQSRWGAERYWTGQPDLVCFAWSEPDQPFWNPATERIEDGWRFVPPHLCLKNKARLGLPPRATPVRLWQSPNAVASGTFDGLLWLVQTDTEQVYSLDGVAADMWRALAAYGDLGVASDYLLSQYQVDETRLQGDLLAFVDELLAKGLIEQVQDATSSAY